MLLLCPRYLLQQRQAPRHLQLYRRQTPLGHTGTRMGSRQTTDHNRRLRTRHTSPARHPCTIKITCSQGKHSSMGSRAIVQQRRTSNHMEPQCSSLMLHTGAGMDSTRPQRHKRGQALDGGHRSLRQRRRSLLHTHPFSASRRRAEVQRQAGRGRPRWRIRW